MLENFLALGGGDALGRVFAFSVTVYLARTLGVAGYGVVAVAQAVVLYLAQFVDFGIETLGNTEIAEDNRRIDTDAPAILTVRTLCALAGASVASVLALTFIPAPDGPIIAAAVFIVGPLAASTRFVHMGLENARPVGGSRVISEAIILGVVLLLVRGMADLWAVPLAQISGECAAALFLLVLLRRRGHRMPLRWDVGKMKAVLRRSWPIMAHSLLGLMIFNADLVFLRILGGPEDAGHYAAAYTLVSFLLNTGAMYAFSLLPTLTRLKDDPEAETHLYQSAMAQVTAAVLPTAVGTTLLAGGIIQLVFGEGYEASAWALTILIWSVPLSLFRTVPMAGLIARKRQDLLLRTTTGAAVMNVVLNIILIPPYGIAGAAGATLATELTRTILGLRYARQENLQTAAWSRHWRALLGCGLMAVTIYFTTLNVFLAVPLGVAVYGAVMLATGGVRFIDGRPAIRV